ncbi:HEAT repeat-containing protein 1 isoform X2 [Pungitius pungitius]|uniref:HEAT repeat-containing protein 1 isoform X2 n=1 Tax=Pungitius pungitius TaxID=134920 RepID=UPI002E0FAAC4
MTSLAHQLKRLALPQSDPDLLTRREVASLLFHPKDAASMDRSTFYALGCTGLEELLGIEPALLEFQDTLFSRASMTLERSVQSKEVNEKLDAGISLFLARLGPYFLLKPAHKCLEWLVHRFHIHLYNVDSLLACALPYHDTNVFVRVLQLLKIKDATNRWSWLHSLQKGGVPLSRGALITHCYTDLSFMDFICSMVTNAVQAYSGRLGECSQLRVVFSFYSSTIVSSLEAVDKVSDVIISKLLPFVQKGLKSPLTDYRASSFMIVCQLAVKVVMEATLVDSLAAHVSRSLLGGAPLTREGLGCLTVLLQNQKEGCVGPRAFLSLTRVPELVSTLQAMATDHDVAPLLRYLVPHLIRTVFSASPGVAQTDELGVLEDVLKSVPLTGGLDRTAARLMLETFLRNEQLSAEETSALHLRLSPLVRLFESRYCAAMDGILAGHVTGAGEQKRLYQQFLSLSTCSGKHQVIGDSNTSLLLSLKHPQPSARVSALEHLMGVVSSAQPSLDEVFLKDAVTERLRDDVPEVVSATLKVMEVLLDVLDPEDSVSSLLSLLHRGDSSHADLWLPVMMEAVHLLSDPRLGKGDAELLQKAGWRLLPFLVITSSEEEDLRLVSCVARSSVVCRHALTQNWAQEFDELMKTSGDEDFVVSANERLVSTLTENLSNMENFSRRDALEQLEQLVEQQRGSALRARVSFLVLTRTLLRSLDQLSGTQHLLTAQRVYALLEAPLLEVIGGAGQEAVSCVAPPSSSFSEALTLYLSTCGRRPGERLDQEFSFILIALLGDFISSLRCHDAAFKGDVWWNPEKLDTNTCCYLGLTCRLFGVIISGAGEGPSAASFRDLMKLLIQVHLSEPPMLFRFLCVLWGYSSNHGDQLDVKVGAVLQTRALYVGGALLSAMPPATREQLVAADSPVVPSLLCCLTSPVREVRRASLAALQVLSEAAASPFQPITEKLLKTSEEIIADPTYLSQALGRLHDEAASLRATSAQKKMRSAITQLLHSARTPSCPSYSACSLLRALSQVNGQSVLSDLLPLLQRLLEQSTPEGPAPLRSEAHLVHLLLGKYNEAAASLLARDQSCLDLFIRALKTSSQPHPDVPSCQVVALEQITKPFFSALGGQSVQQQLLTVVLDVLVETSSPLVTDTVSCVFKAVTIDGQLVANELAPPERPKENLTVQQTRRSMMSQRRQRGGSEGGPAVSWRRVTLILELLQHKKKLRSPQALLPALFSLLARSQQDRPGDQVNMEYTKQLLLSCLLNICHKLGPDGGGAGPAPLEEDKFNVELVVQCIRTSDVPQTHHHALLLLAAAAAIFPEKVLLNIMPIFTFMGANIMRLDDAYSFRVIDRTVQMVIPALIQAHQLADGSSPSHVVAVVTRILHVFADALPHVPDHRRLPILSQLMTTLGPERFLWVLMLILFKLHAKHTAKSTSEKDVALEKDVDFWISLSCLFGVTDQLTTIINILDFLLQLPDDKDGAPLKRRQRPTKQQQKEVEEEEVQELIFSLETHSSKELRHFKFLSLSFMAQLLGSAGFVGKVADGVDAVDESLQQRLLEEVLRYIHSVAGCVEDNTDRPTAKFWRVLLNKAYEVLDKVNSLLPTDTFITVMRGLMGNHLPSVRRKAMELLNNKLQHRTQWEEQQVTVLLQLSGNLLGIVGKGSCQGTQAEQAINRQTALYSLKLLCRSFGGDHQEAFVPILRHAVDIVVATEEEKNVTGSALLCIAEVVATLKALAIPQLPRLMPAVLSALTDRKELSTNEIYLLSAVTALQRVVETLPHFISPYLQDTTSQVCRLTRLVESSSSSSSSATQLSARLASLRSSLATRLPPRVLLPTLTRCYGSMVLDRKRQLGALMSILKEHIGHMEKDQLNFHQSELTSFFLTALDFRAEHCQGDLEKTAEVEGHVIDCLVAMVMKLSEVTFRPLFFKLLDWSKAASGERLLTFYRLSDVIAERLKGLFVLFAGNLVKPISDLLKQTCGSKSDEVLFGSEEKTRLLLRSVLNCLFKVFLFDTQRFLSRERAEALMGPLVDQLGNTAGGDQVYQVMVTQHLVPCLGQFCAALTDDSQWKTLNYQVLLKTRHPESKVRFSSLLVLMELASKLKENYMVLLPETIPFLAELMEDECEEVEQQVQKVVQEMENILGEPLQSYF